jgi:hypothetical protein
MPIDTTQWKPLVFGRFMMLAPQDAISAGTYHLWTDPIELRKDLTSMELLKNEVAAKRDEFKSQKHVNFGNRYINTYDLDGKGFSVWGYEFGEINDLNTLHYATVYTYYFCTNAFRVWMVTRTLPLDDGDKQQELDYELKLAQAIRPLQDGEVPKDYGFVIEGGMVTSDEYRGEDANFSYWTPAFLMPNPDSPTDGFAGFTVTTVATARTSDTTLFQRLDKGLTKIGAWVSGDRVLRRRELVVGGIAGQEYLYRTSSTRSDWTEYHFVWDTNGKVEDNYHPDIAVRFEMSTPNSPELPPAPFKSDEDAMAFWGAALGSLQLRPVTTATGSQVSEAGTVETVAILKTGQTCPMTGIWEASLPPGHPSARNLASAQSRFETVQIGQLMPEVYAKFMSPQTADADNAAITWTLVRGA